MTKIVIEIEVAGGTPSMTEQDLRKMKIGEVAEMARKAGIKNVESMNKEQLIEALGKGKGSSAPGRGGGKGDSPKPRGVGPKDWKNVPGNQS